MNWFGRLPVGQTFILSRIHLALSIWPELDLGHLILAQIILISQITTGLIITRVYPQY